MSDSITIWTIQPIEWYNELLKKGIITGNRQFVDPSFLDGYEWMVTQMRSRIGASAMNDPFPIWGWLQYNGAKQSKPDLRRAGHLLKGTNGVRLEIQKRREDVLLSDFQLWHFPLSYKSYIADNELEDDLFEKQLELHSPEARQDLIEKSWEKIFDLDYSTPYSSFPKEKKMIQATFWSLKLEDVTSIKRFVAR